MKNSISAYIIAFICMACSKQENQSSADSAKHVSEEAQFVSMKNIPYMTYQVVKVSEIKDTRLKSYGYFDVMFSNGLNRKILVEFINGDRNIGIPIEASGFMISRPNGSPFQEFPADSIEKKMYQHTDNSGLGFGNTLKFNKPYLSDYSNPPGMYDVFIITAVLSPPDAVQAFNKIVGFNSESVTTE